MNDGLLGFPKGRREKGVPWSLELRPIQLYLLSSVDVYIPRGATRIAFVSSPSCSVSGFSAATGRIRLGSRGLLDATNTYEVSNVYGDTTPLGGGSSGVSSGFSLTYGTATSGACFSADLRLASKAQNTWYYLASCGYTTGASMYGGSKEMSGEVNIARLIVDSVYFDTACQLHVTIEGIT